MKRLTLAFAIILAASVAWAGIPASPPATSPSDTAYNATTWDASKEAATKNAIRDQLILYLTLGGGTMTGNLVISNAAPAFTSCQLFARSCAPNKYARLLR